MITPNPIEGIGFHAAGAASASTCYLPFHKTKKWSWVAYWLIQSLFAWILAPLVIALITVPDFFDVIKQSPSNIVWLTFLLGGMYGFGGMSFGFATRYIGYSLTYAISIGLSAVLGTVLPLLIKGNLIGYFQQSGGNIILIGMIVALLGVALCGLAGFKKEREVKAENKGKFNMKKGFMLAAVAGVLSGVFNIALEIGQPIADLASKKGAGIYEDNAKLIIATAGCFVVNVIWFTCLGIKQKNLVELTVKSNIPKPTLFRNFLWAAFGGVLWCMQFFFYGLGHVKMGRFQFASWVIHMSMLIFFSFLVGLAMKEWRNVSKKTYATLIIALIVLGASFFILSFGSMQ